MNTIENAEGNAMDASSNVIIHLGACLGASAPLYQHLGYKQLVLVEAAPELAKLLNKKWAHKENVRIKNSIVSAQNAHVEFHTYSNPRYGSQLALQPEFINNSNLHLQEKKQVSAVSLSQLTTELTLTDNQYNTLIVELNGYEAQFLQALPPEQMAIFSRVIVNLQ